MRSNIFKFVVTDVLDKAGENMEHFAIMCYIGLLFGQLVTQSEVIFFFFMSCQRKKKQENFP